MLKTQAEEVIKCCNSFNYFCDNYVKIFHPTKGLVPFKLLPWHKRLGDALEENRFLITTKWRQGGLATTTIAYCLWLCTFHLDKRVLWLSTDANRQSSSESFRLMLKLLPDWMRPKLEIDNVSAKNFSETGSEIRFWTPEPACGKAATHFVIDEASFIPDMECNWKCLWPLLSTGGKCYILSTTTDLSEKNDGYWFFETYQKAVKNQNYFYVFKSDYKESPEYKDPDFAKHLREALGEKQWQIEVEGSFLL